MTAYASVDTKSKKMLKERVSAGEKISVTNVTPVGIEVVKSGKAYISGPHYPKPHSWYAEVDIVDGYITKIK